MASRERLVLRSGETLKQFLPIYLQRILKHYDSKPPPSGFPHLSPRDFHLHKDRSMTSAILKIAPSVVSVSVFAGVKRLLDCSGIVFEWDDSTCQATILTSAKLMRFPGKRDNYYFVVRLPSGKILLAEEHYVDYYHNIMTLKVSSDAKLDTVELHSSAPPIEEGVKVVALNRDFYTCRLSESSGTIHADYPYFGCELLRSSTCVGNEVGEGGPLINEMGHVCGINFFDGYQCVHPLPTSVILSCLDTWTSNGIVMQPWFGMTVIDISKLPYYALDKVARVRGDGTAVIKEVYEGSPADTAGVRPGDSVITLVSQVSYQDLPEALPRGLTSTQNEVSVSSATEYALALSSISKDLNDDSTIDIMVFLRNDSGEDVVVRSLNLRVNDKRFCSSLSEHEPNWHEPLFGSQAQPAYDVAINTNPCIF
ncbi:hypothetical protein POM88_002186 [Heracleum sosnowskyi]|uniref:PDZ domain-containing protein n=1 Tax=Heracleum sosnowskyi TaxID=360622 RepID=A0AAD8JH88_9APIA|nr:hypothetical protein POM88_002186 [Heracleum sosnowskyi]